MADLAAFVTQARGLSFDHPVHVDFLSEQEFIAEVVADTPSEEARLDSDRDAAVLRALGLVSGAVDLLAGNDQVAEQGIAAYYDPATERITIRGDEMTPLLRATVVHELTHTLQDQNFDLGRLLRTETVAASTAFRALAEGDALRIEYTYVASLEPADRELHAAQQQAQFAAADLGGTPAVLVALFSAPYTLGAQFVHLLAAEGGNEAVDAAFEDPPTTEEHLLNPRTFLAGQTVADDIADPPRPDEIDPFEEGEFGALLLYLMLAERLEPAQALAAVDGWNGDRYAAFTRSTGQVCVAARFAADDDTELEELVGVLRAWRDAHPVLEPAVDRDGGTVTLQSCDPGATAELSLQTDGLVDALLIPVS